MTSNGFSCADPPAVSRHLFDAAPAVAAAALALVGFPVLLKSGAAGPPDFGSLLPLAQSVGAPWIVLAAAATLGSLLLSKRLAGERF